MAQVAGPFQGRSAGSMQSPHQANACGISPQSFSTRCVITQKRLGMHKLRRSRAPSTAMVVVRNESEWQLHDRHLGTIVLRREPGRGQASVGCRVNSTERLHSYISSPHSQGSRPSK